MTKGELLIAGILNQNKIKYSIEFSPTDLKSSRGKPMRFDFVIYNFDDSIQCFIEYDGEQHFHFSKYFTKTSSDFNYRLEQDVRKNVYALTKKIPLYRVPYYDFDNIKELKDIYKEIYRVKTKWHNHDIRFKLAKEEKGRGNK